jgi:outer membrane protein
MNKKSIVILLVLSCIHASVWADKKPIMSTDELLYLAEKNSQSIIQSQLNVLVAEKEIDIAKAPLQPNIIAEAIDSAGFAGSSGWIGEQGLVGSPFRSGITGGFALRQLITDFGRTNADVRASQLQVNVSKQTARVTKYEVKALALQVFYQCAKFKKQRDIWGHLAKESGIINGEAKHFVKTGQRSVVDNYLSDSQTEEARTAYAYFQKRVEGSLQQLALITGKSSQSFACPALSNQLMHALIAKNQIDTSPYVQRAQAQAKVAQDTLLREKAELMPKIIGVASVGGMHSAHFVNKENYAVGIGVTMPVLDFSIKSRINRAQAQLLAKQQDIAVQKQYLEEMNAKLDEVINASRTRIKHLTFELDIANEGFKIAKKRYFDLEGDLVDLREAWRNLARAEITIEDARYDFLQANGVKALLNDNH